ncbi:MAG TPA: hypothetical protein VNX68_04790 [Nitrosopumilaceae archaeon]|jgi:hypothetical protein|nr:hypothetical protein [Nitrosopumilaceae archaeon]
MPIGIVSSDEFLAELEELRTTSEVIPIVKGRGNAKEVPDSMREIIAEEAINGSSAKVISHAFGVSESSISAYKNGAHSTSSYHSPVSSLLSSNNRVKEVIASRSKRVLLRALKEITDEKLKDTKAVELSSIARNMGGIINDMTPKNEVNVNMQNKVIVYAPRIREESEFEVLDVIDA